MWWVSIAERWPRKAAKKPRRTTGNEATFTDRHAINDAAFEHGITLKGDLRNERAQVVGIAPARCKHCQPLSSCPAPTSLGALAFQQTDARKARQVGTGA